MYLHTLDIHGELPFFKTGCFVHERTAGALRERIGFLTDGNIRKRINIYIGRMQSVSVDPLWQLSFFHIPLWNSDVGRLMPEHIQVKGSRSGFRVLLLLFFLIIMGKSFIFDLV